MILAHAAASPAWAVRNSIIRYFAQDIDILMVKCTSASLMLYGLNGYGLQLQAAAREAIQAWQQRAENEPALATSSPARTIRDVYRNGANPLRIDDSQATFEKMFKVAAVRQPTPAAAHKG